MNDDKLASYLRQWAREYGPGGGMHERSDNILASLIQNRGFISGYGRQAASKTTGDEVERAVVYMQGLPKPERGFGCADAAKVLRVHYQIGSHYADEDRFEMLALAGVKVKKSAYHHLLHRGKGCLVGWFSALEIARR